MAIQTTTLPALEELIKPLIEGITPASTRHQSDGWTYAGRRELAGHRNRRFRLWWQPLGIRDGGFFTDESVETLCELTVEVDYAIPEEHSLEIIDDDYHQIYEVLDKALHSPGTTAEVLVTIEESLPFEVEEAQAGHGDRLTASFPYVLSYMRTRRY